MTLLKIDGIMKVMEKYGAIPTDWGHFLEEATPFLKNEDDSTNNEEHCCMCGGESDILVSICEHCYDHLPYN